MAVFLAAFLAAFFLATFFLVAAFLGAADFLAAFLGAAFFVAFFLATDTSSEMRKLGCRKSESSEAVDQIQVFRPNLKSGKLVANDPAVVTIHPGGGPRHFAFHPKKRFAYAINELDCTVTVFAFEPKTGALTELQTITTLPRPYQSSDSCADIHLSQEGRYLYGSNRGHDSIAIFAVDSTTGKLSVVGHESTQGKTPRNFALDPTGSFLYAANQNSDSIVAFRIDKKTGKLTATGQKIEVPSPVCIVFEKA